MGMEPGTEFDLHSFPWQYMRNEVRPAAHRRDG